MCTFFSIRTNGRGKIYYLNAEQRKEVLAKGENPDSHTFIAEYYGFEGEREDKLNAYEYNPLTKEFSVDRMNTKNDEAAALEFCKNLDYKTIVPELIIKPIIHPFSLEHGEVTQTDIDKLKQWDSVRASVWASVRDSVWASVRASVGDLVGDLVWASVWDSVWDSVRASVWASVWDSVWDSVRASVWASVRDSVRDSVGDSVGAYISSFFGLSKWRYIEHAEGENPFQCCIDLWESGLVPSFDGSTWRLHGNDAKIVYEVKRDALT